MNTEQIKIVRRSDRTMVDAQLLSNLKPTDLLMVERQWETSRQLTHQRLLAGGIDRRSWPQSLGWDWKRKAPILGQLAIGGYGIVESSDWQAVCLVDCVSFHSRLSILTLLRSHHGIGTSRKSGKKASLVLAVVFSSTECVNGVLMKALRGESACIRCRRRKLSINRAVE